MGKLTLPFDVEGWLQADQALYPKQWTPDPLHYKHVPLGAFSIYFLQETPKAGKSDPDISKFSLLQAPNTADLAFMSAWLQFGNALGILMINCKLEFVLW